MTGGKPALPADTESTEITRFNAVLVLISAEQVEA